LSGGREEDLLTNEKEVKTYNKLQEGALPSFLYLKEGEGKKKGEGKGQIQTFLMK